MANEQITKEAAANAQADEYINATAWIPQFPMGGIIKGLSLAVAHIEQGRTYDDFADLEFTGSRMRKVRQETAKIHRDLGVANVHNLDERNAMAWEMVRSGASRGLYLLKNRDNSDTSGGITPLKSREVNAAREFLGTEAGRDITKELLAAAEKALNLQRVKDALERYKTNTIAISKRYAEQYPNERVRNSSPIRELKTGEMNGERGAFMRVAGKEVADGVKGAGRGLRGVEGFIGAITARPSDALFRAHGLEQ